MEIVAILTQLSNVLKGIAGATFVISLVMACIFKFSSGFNEKWGEKSKDLFISAMFGGGIYMCIDMFSTFFGF